MKIFEIDSREYFESNIKITWQNEKIFFMKNYNIFEIDVDKKKEKMIYCQDISGFEVIGDKIVVASEEAMSIKEISTDNFEIIGEVDDVSGRMLGIAAETIYVRDRYTENTYIYSREYKTRTFLPISCVDILCKDQEFSYCYSEGKILKLKKEYKDDEDKVITLLENIIEGKFINGREVLLDKIFFEMDVNDRYLFLVGGDYLNPVNKKNRSNLWRMNKEGERLIKIYDGEVFNITVHEEYIYFIDRELGMSLCRVDFEGNEFEIMEDGLCCEYSIEKNKVVIVKYDRPHWIVSLQEELCDLEEKYVEYLFDLNIQDDDFSIRIAIENDIGTRSEQIRKFFRNDVCYEYKIKNL